MILIQYISKFQYNLRIKQQMSISLINKITKGSKQPIQKCYRFPQNKQNKKCNGQNEKSGRHRNDHSIQIKSPLKIPANTVRKGDLTFRNRTEPCNVIVGSQTLPVRFSQTLNTQLNENLDKVSMKINLRNLQVPNAKIGRFVSDVQANLIDKLWSICTKLISYENQYTQSNLSKIQLEIKKILTLLAEQNLHDEAPLASSKKINLQNCLAYSQCEKQIDHKEFQSSHQYESSINVQIDAESQNIQEVYTGKTIKTQSASFQSPKIQSHTTKNSNNTNNTKNIQVKKIMYMLDGKTKNNESLPSRIEPVLLSSNKRSYQSLSSFNQHSNDDSGFTVFEIERCSERTSQYSKQPSEIEQNIQQIPIKFYKKTYRQTQNKKNYGKRTDFEAHQSISQRSQQLQQTSNIQIGSKRKVLNDIVTMLNHKYNKNIRLQ